MILLLTISLLFPLTYILLLIALIHGYILHVKYEKHFHKIMQESEILRSNPVDFSNKADEFIKHRYSVK